MALDYPEEHRREALAITAAVVLLLVLVCFFLTFTGPNPPLTALGGDGVEPELRPRRGRRGRRADAGHRQRLAQ